MFRRLATIIVFSAVMQLGIAGQTRSSITNPEVFELANIAYALTEFSETDVNMTQKSGDYFQKVMKWFGPFRDHEVVLRLNEQVKKNYLSYVANRGYAINFAFEADKLIETGRYPAERKIQIAFFGDAFADKAAWEDFAAKSQFRKFYSENKKLYDSRIADARTLLPIDQIQTWLEREFPARYDNYSIVVSPMINATHSTFNSGKSCFMFVSDTGSYDNAKFTPKQIEGLYSGIVFTEIDHNYNNPVSAKFAAEIADAMPDISAWSNGAEAKSGGYKTALKVFDEYATHSLYLIYVNEYFGAKDYEFLKQRRIDLMLNRRGFSRLGEFHEAFLALNKAKKPGETIADLYPKIIEWVKKQK